MARQSTARREQTEEEIHPSEERTPHRLQEPLSRRGLAWVAVAAVFALVLLFVASHFDEYLRRTLESKINQHLTGYTVSLQRAHLSPLGFSLTLEGAAIRQQANPEPPVAFIPRLTASIEWRELLSFHLVANAAFDQPRVHLNLPQLRQEDRDRVELEDRGWQDALESIYPFKFNLVEVRDGAIVYIDEDPEKPLQISHWNFSASNIRNTREHDLIYPSPVHSEGVIFEKGRGVVDGHADFLSKPFPGIHAVYRVANVPLDRLDPISSRANLSLEGGILSSAGEFEYGPKNRQARIDDVTVSRLHLDYIHTAATAPAERERGREVAEAAKDQTPAVPVLQRLRLTDSRVGFINRAERPFRVFLDGTDLEVTNLSSGFRHGPAKARVTGRFMGNGTARGSATFRDNRNGPDFEFALAVENANLPSLNELFRSYGKLDVAGGTFSVYSEVKVSNGRITGYAKPLFQDVDVYDSEQDKKKPVLKKLYEKVVGGLSHILENQPRDEVATVADLSGSVEDPNTSTWEIVVRLVSNAFGKAILPGFDREFEKARRD